MTSGVVACALAEVVESSCVRTDALESRKHRRSLLPAFMGTNPRVSEFGDLLDLDLSELIARVNQALAQDEGDGTSVWWKTKSVFFRAIGEHKVSHGGFPSRSRRRFFDRVACARCSD
jgi:hypothetical protein